MSRESKILIKEVQSGETLYSFSLDESEQAYEKLQSLINMSLDVDIFIPTVTDTLCDSLGMNREEMDTYNESLIEEIDDHNH